MTTKTIKKRLEVLRTELRAERISYGELHELQGLAQHIDSGDVELLEAAGVPEGTKLDEWLASFKAEFLRKTGITWEDAGLEDKDAIDRYFPEDVQDAVLQHMEKYDLDDVTQGW